jgi:hypothetical protein
MYFLIEIIFSVLAKNFSILDPFSEISPFCFRENEQRNIYVVFKAVESENRLVGNFEKGEL